MLHQLVIGIKSLAADMASQEHPEFLQWHRIDADGIKILRVTEYAGTALTGTCGRSGRVAALCR
jgi:hypothetical protein